MIHTDRLFDFVVHQCSCEIDNEPQFISIPLDKTNVDFAVVFRKAQNPLDDDDCCDAFIVHEYHQITTMPTIRVVYDEFEPYELYKLLVIKLQWYIKQVRGCPCCGVKKWIRKEATVCFKCADVILFNAPKPDECSICREGLGVYYTNPYSCKHEFHVKCSKQWKGKCPLCRATIK